MRRTWFAGGVAAAASALMVGGVMSASADNTPDNIAPPIHALDTAQPASVDAASREVISRLEAAASFDTNLREAVAIDAANGERWIVAPTDDGGACVTYEDGVVGCGAGVDLDSGSFGVTSVAAPTGDAADRLAAAVAKAQAGEDVQLPVTKTRAVRRGLVPDGIAALRAENAAGETIATASVVRNTYVLPLGLEGQAERIKYLDANGNVSRNFTLR